MCRMFLQLLILVTLSCLLCADNEAEVFVVCKENQKAFGGSCYEFEAQQHTFFSAQALCEETGGHLAFIQDEDTQFFLQKHLDPEKDVWVGIAPSTSPNLQNSSTTDGALSWLNGSQITYSKWARSPQTGAACGHILKDSGFQWEATGDCNKKLQFICQFESGRSTVCAGHNVTLQCSSGQVLMIDGCFYGRENIHYCRSQLSPPTTKRQQCDWVDVVESVAAHCHNRQVCQVAEVVKSLGEPCPHLGSYLSVEYHCKDGLTLTVSTVAAVFKYITMNIKWLLHMSRGNLVCKLSTGDGNVIFLDSPEGLESNVVYRYTYPGTFVVAAECTSSGVHIAAEQIISILEPITEIAVIGCYTGKQFFHAFKCKALYGRTFQIQIKVQAGSNVTYRVQSKNMLLSDSSVIRGNVPHNITVTSEMVKQLGPGCHHLLISVFNRVTFPELSTDLQVCVLEKVAGLRASVLRDNCLVSPDISVGVSLEQGAPVLLLFSLTGHNNSFYETREMNARTGIFKLKRLIQGTVQIKLTARNIFSSLEVDVDMFELISSCGKDSHIEINDHIHKRLGKRHSAIKTVSSLDIVATPSASVSYKTAITLFIGDVTTLMDPQKIYQWECTHPCSCQGNFVELNHTISKSCLPDPFQFNKYHFNVINRANNNLEQTQSICITYSPNAQIWLRVTCTEGCDPMIDGVDAKLQLECVLNMCPSVLWYIEDPRSENDWEVETRSCYVNAGKKPLTQLQQGGNQYTVRKTDLALAKSRGQNVTVVVISASNIGFFTTYTIKTAVAPTTIQPRSTGVTSSFNDFQCSISPGSGTIFDAFNITCNTRSPCYDCQYCFKSQGYHLRCSMDNEVKFVFLPHGDSNNDLKITATMKNNSFSLSTNITVQVQDLSQTTSVNNLKGKLTKAVVQLKEQGQLSGETLGQLYISVANKINQQSNISDRKELRQEMLYTMIDAVNDFPNTIPEEVQLTARGLTAVVQEERELDYSDQVEASLLFANLSSSLVHMDLNKSEENTEEMFIAASAIVEGVGIILGYSSDKNISNNILATLNYTQSALLVFKEANEGPTVIQKDNIGVFVNRVTPGSLNTEAINIPNSSTAFSLPTIPADTLPSDTVDVRMLNLDVNPFSWNEKGDVRGQIAGLALTAKDGSTIPVKNLNEDVEILLPRPVGEQVNTTVLYLGNYSTTIINVPSDDTTLVLKMLPSEEPLPFKLFLGYMDYPTGTNYVAMTEMPHQGTTLEEKYTWLLDPETLKGNTGLHYLVVRPIVGPGIKFIDANLSVSSITAACKFWNESTLDWSTNGCRVGIQSTNLVTQCLCNHLTFFGSSFFVTPNLVDPSRSAELFGTFAENPVVVCFVGSLFVAYFVVVVWARRKDIQDIPKVKVTVLDDNDPIDEYCYLIVVNTGHRRGASTSSQVTVTLLGADANSEPHHLTDPKKCVFERGAEDMFLLTTPFSLGDLQGVRLWHNNSGSHPAWYVGNTIVQDLQTNQKWHFLCNSWLAIDIDDGCLDKVFPVSTEMDLKSFSNLFFMKSTKDFSDGHLWYSVISRPPSSTFTCVQRVSCCFSLLLCTMLTSIMFYGIPTDPSEQTMDLGHFEFTWQQFMIGVQSSLIMFPVNILIVSIFRNAQPREMSCCKRTKKKTDALEQEKSLKTASFESATTNRNVTLDIIIKDITRIACSLSKTLKSNIPYIESGQVDINTLLNVVEEFVRQKNKASDSTQVPNLIQPQLPESNENENPETNQEEIQRKSNKNHYLYKQLCHIDKELNLLGPSGFPTPYNYSQVLQKIQHIKSILEVQLFTSSHDNLDEINQIRLSPADSTDNDNNQKKNCCHGGLPWWFIYVGWLLVITTSCVAGYFTMLYGLKFGKERSISWLVSIIVSFFQSVLIIQPLKVLCLAVFFALVIKKVDEENYQNVAFEKKFSNPGDCKDCPQIRQDKNLYEPPPPSDIEKMKRQRILEQKAYALLREILIYMGFMWMLLLVAYGQRDPNAYFLNKHIRDCFSGQITESMSLREVFNWASTSLLSNLFGVYPGFITDGNSKLVGNARLRQLRVQKNSCQIDDSMLHFVPDCHAPYSWEEEDMGSYNPGWNHTVMDNISWSTSSPWTYQTQAQLRAYPIWGKMVLYRGGGFVAELGPDLNNASSTLEYLFRNKWLDMYTRAIFVEFTVYNANVNLFCIVTLLFETAAVGAFQLHTELQSVRLYQSTGGLHIFIMASEIIYLFFIIYYMFLQGKLMKQQRWTYFRKKWNLVELAIILLSWSALAVFIKRTLLGNRDMTFYQNHKDQFASFYETATADSVLQYLIAFLVLFSTVKLWHLFRLNPKMNMIIATLERAWSDISGFLVVIIIMLMAYSIACTIIYGWKLASYRTLVDTLLTMISMQMGIFNYAEVLDDTQFLGGFLFGSCTVFMSFVLLNLLISVILVAFNEEQLYHKPSDEEEIVNLMLKKICSLFGIRYRETKDSAVPDVNSSSSLTTNNSETTPSYSTD